MAVRWPQPARQPLDELGQGIISGASIGLNIESLIARKRQREQELSQAQEREKVNSAYKAVEMGIKLNLPDERLQPAIDVINASMGSTGLDLTGKFREYGKKLITVRKEVEKGNTEAGLMGMKMLQSEYPIASKSLTPEIQNLEKQIETTAARRETVLSNLPTNIPTTTPGGTTAGLLPTQGQVSPSAGQVSPIGKIPPVVRKALAENPNDPIAKRYMDVVTRKKGKFDVNSFLKENLGDEDFLKLLKMEKGLIPKAGTAKNQWTIKEGRLLNQVTGKTKKFPVIKKRDKESRLWHSDARRALGNIYGQQTAFGMVIDEERMTEYLDAMKNLDKLQKMDFDQNTAAAMAHLLAKEKNTPATVTEEEKGVLQTLKDMFFK